MVRTRYAVIVAALAAATVAGGINAEAAPAEPAQLVAKPATSRHAPSARAAAAPQSGNLFNPLPPTRVLDTRNGIGALGPGGQVILDLSTAGVPIEAEAVVLNVTGTEVTGNTFVTVYPNDPEGRPDVSNLNLVPGQTRPNAVTVATPLDGSRKIVFYNNAGNTHLIADLAGYYRPGVGSAFTTQSPIRVLDTRGTTGPVGQQGTITIDLSGQVAATATAVTFNLTGTEPTANTFITAFPAGGTRPLASSLNLVPGETAPNLVTVQLSADKKVSLFNNVGTTHLVADLAGYYRSDIASGDQFFPLVPSRAFDSRDFNEPLPAGITGRLNFPAVQGVDQIHSIVLNMTGTEPTAATFMTAWPAQQTRPLASNLNLVAGQTVPNLITVAVGGPTQAGAAFALDFFNNAGFVHFILDYAGVFAPAHS